MQPRTAPAEDGEVRRIDLNISVTYVMLTDCVAQMLTLISQYNKV